MEKIRNQITSWIERYKQDPVKNSIILGSVLLLCILSETSSSLTVVVLAALIYYLGYRPNDFGYRYSPARNLGYAFFAALCLFLFAQIELVLHSKALFIMPQSYSLGNLILYAILLAVLEETLYRGFIFSFKSKIKHEYVLIAFIGIVYMLHMRSLNGLLLGLVLGMMTLKSNSLYPAIFTSFMTRILMIYEFHHIEQFTWLLKLFSTRSAVESAGMYLLGFGFFALAMSWACRCISHEEKQTDVETIRINRIQIPKTPLWRNKEKTNARQAYVLSRMHRRMNK